MTITEMLERKRELGYSYEQIAELSGVPIGTVQKVLGGITKSPRHETLCALERVLGEVNLRTPFTGEISRAAEYTYMRSASSHEQLAVREPAPAYGARTQGSYTIEDYYVLPEDVRAELIDGVFYDMASPSFIHQLIGGQIYLELANYIHSKNGNCIPAMAPLGVQLDRDNKTMVEPDVFVVCDRDRIKKRNLYGAPDFVVEVLSPSTKKKDRSLKLNKYMKAGVREYWIVDTERKHVTVYLADEEIGYDIFVYSFDEKVPVHIFNDECEVDFKAIYEYLGFLYEKE